MPSRRAMLALTAGSVAAGLAGCTSRLGIHGRLDVVAANARDSAVDVAVHLYDPAADEASDALVYSVDLTVPASDGGGRTVRSREGVVPDRAYRIEVEAGTPTRSHHYHYLPDCRAGAPYEPGVEIRLVPDGGVEFTQATCSGDDPFR